MEKNYYYIKISKFWTIFWLVISILIILGTEGKGFLIIIIPVYYYDLLKNCKYYYNDDKLMIEFGIFNKNQFIIPLYRIINLTANDNIFNFGYIRIEDKGQTILLKYIKNSRDEMNKLIDKWEKAKINNVRNEVI